ncbi:hypothetical protein PAMP_015598 [Pampus punctatissimus]
MALDYQLIRINRRSGVVEEEEEGGGEEGREIQGGEKRRCRGGAPPHSLLLPSSNRIRAGKQTLPHSADMCRSSASGRRNTIEPRCCCAPVSTSSVPVICSSYGASASSVKPHAIHPVIKCSLLCSISVPPPPPPPPSLSPIFLASYARSNM